MNIKQLRQSRIGTKLHENECSPTKVNANNLADILRIDIMSKFITKYISPKKACTYGLRLLDYAKVNQFEVGKLKF